MGVDGADATKEGGVAGAVPGVDAGLLLDGPLTVMVAVVPVDPEDEPAVDDGPELGVEEVPGVGDPEEKPPKASSREASMAAIAPGLPLVS